MTVKEKRTLLKKIMTSPGCTPAVGVYDAISAKVVEKTGFEVAYLGSFATAASILGFPDVGAVTMTEMVEHAKHVAASIDIPLICDAENGFFHAANIWRTVREFEAAGVSAIHIEDHEFGKHTQLAPVILDADKTCKKIEAALAARTDDDFLILARTDTPWAYKDMEEAVRRANLYLQAGADAVLLATGADMMTMEMRQKINGPVVALSHRGVSVQEESDKGINISLYWPMLLYTSMVACREACELFKKTQDYDQLGKYVFNEPEFNKYTPFAEFLDRADKYLE